MSEAMDAWRAAWERQQEVYKRIADEPATEHCPLSWTPPNLSESAGVHPEQVTEAMDDAKHKGVPTDFLPDGRAVFTSRKHQARYLKAYGYHNNDGGFGD